MVRPADSTGLNAFPEFSKFVSPPPEVEVYLGEIKNLKNELWNVRCRIRFQVLNCCTRPSGLEILPGPYISSGERFPVWRAR